jgi:hypothetical protein
MASTSAPTYYFSGIDFNQNFYQDVASTGIIIARSILSPSNTLTLGSSSSTITIPGTLNISNAITLFTTTVTPSANVTISNTLNGCRFYSLGSIKYVVGNFRVTYSSAVQNTGVISFTLPTSFLTTSVYSCSIGQTLVNNSNLGFYSCVSATNITTISFYIVCSGTPTIGNFVGVSYFITGV